MKTDHVRGGRPQLHSGPRQVPLWKPRAPAGKSTGLCGLPVGESLEFY